MRPFQNAHPKAQATGCACYRRFVMRRLSVRLILMWVLLYLGLLICSCVMYHKIRSQHIIGILPPVSSQAPHKQTTALHPALGVFRSRSLATLMRAFVVKKEKDIKETRLLKKERQGKEVSPAVIVKKPRTLVLLTGSAVG